MGAGLLTLKGEKKPAYFALRKLLKEDWSTQWRGAVQDGVAVFRGFFGAYEAEIPGYKAARFNLKSKGPRDLTVQLLR